MDTGPRVWAGLALTGYGTLVLMGVLAHDAPSMGALALALGLLFLLPGLPRTTAPRARPLAGLGASIAGGTLLYNLASSSDLGPPELGLVGYGAALVAASARLDRPIGRTDVATLVAWSFPLVLAPLGFFALNGLLSNGSTGTAAAPLVRVLLVWPTYGLLRATGTGAELWGTNIILPTQAGSLTLGVGLVCAGIYPMILFGAILALHAWRTKMARPEWVRLLALGILGLWIMNLVRLLALAKVGQAYGAQELQQVHAHLGWLLFVVFMVAFWAVAPRLARMAPKPAIAA